MAKPHENSGVVNLIGVGTTIVGDITSTGDIRVDGTLSGSINTKGKVINLKHLHIFFLSPLAPFRMQKETKEHIQPGMFTQFPFGEFCAF